MKRNYSGLVTLLALANSPTFAQEEKTSNATTELQTQAYYQNQGEPEERAIIETSSGVYVFNKQINSIKDKVTKKEGSDVFPPHKVFPFAADFYTWDEVKKTNTWDEKNNRQNVFLEFNGESDLITFTLQPIKKIQINFESSACIPRITFHRENLIDRVVRYFPAKDQNSETLVFVEGDTSNLETNEKGYLELSGDSKEYRIFIGTKENKITSPTYSEKLEEVPSAISQDLQSTNSGN